MSTTSFDFDLRDGQLGESEFLEQLRAIGHRGEHKRDYTANRTGRVIMEFERRRWRDGKVEPSGVFAGNDVFVVEIPQTKVRLTMPSTFAQDLVRLAVAHDQAAWVGDGGRSHCAFIPPAWFLSGG